VPPSEQLRAAMPGRRQQGVGRGRDEACSYLSTSNQLQGGGTWAGGLARLGANCGIEKRANRRVIRVCLFIRVYIICLQSISKLNNNYQAKLDDFLLLNIIKVLYGICFIWL